MSRVAEEQQYVLRLTGPAAKVQRGSAAGGQAWKERTCHRSKTIMGGKQMTSIGVGIWEVRDLPQFPLHRPHDAPPPHGPHHCFAGDGRPDPHLHAVWPLHVNKKYIA